VGEDTVKASIELVKAVQKQKQISVASFFASEENAVKMMNPYMLIFIAKQAIAHCPWVLLDEPNLLPNVFDTLLLLTLFFKEDQVLVEKLFFAGVAVLGFVGQNVEKVHNVTLILNSNMII